MRLINVIFVEKNFGNGQKYITVLSDPINKCVLDIIEGRKVEDTEELLTWTLSPKQIKDIWIVSIDMWKPYMHSVRRNYLRYLYASKVVKITPTNQTELKR